MELEQEFSSKIAVLYISSRKKCFKKAMDSGLMLSLSPCQRYHLWIHWSFGSWRCSEHKETLLLYCKFLIPPTHFYSFDLTASEVTEEVRETAEVLWVATEVLECFFPARAASMLLVRNVLFPLPEFPDKDCFGFCFKSRDNSRMNSRKKYGLLFLLLCKIIM